MATVHAVITINFVYILIMAILYFTKKKVINRENIYLSILLVLTLITLAFEIVNNIVLIKYQASALFPHKAYELTVAVWSTIFFMYAMHIVDGENDKVHTKTTEYLKIAGVLVYMMAVSVIVFLLPSKIEFVGNYPYESGSTVIFLGFMNFMYLLFIDIYLFMNGRKEIRKVLPIITYELAIIIYGVLRFFVISPAYTIYSLVSSVVVIVMINTIQNTDLKIITELDAAKQETAKATRAKSDFLSSMSHEIRTPLNAIVGLSELMLDEDINDSLRKDLDDIIYASQNLLDIVGNILDINKIESNSMEIQNMNYLPTELAAELIRINKVRIGPKNIKLVSNIAPDVPYELVGDKIHIKQIINNLLSNAIKYTDEGSVTMNISARNDGFVSNLIVQVTDTGKGIKTSDFDKLFTKFERLDTEIDSTISGSGLGLAITKKLVELLNGSIRVKSIYGKGSTFEVIIPQSISMMINPKQVELEYKIEQIENEEQIGEAKRKQILLVDDSTINLKIASGYLKGLDVIIDTALNGKEAVDKVKSKTYDIIFLDLKMPGMDGFKTLDEMKLIEGFKTPVVAFTAVEEDVEATCLNAGFSGFLIKPFSKDQLIKKINSVLGIILRGSEAIDAPTPEEKKVVEAAPVVDIPIQDANDTPAIPDPSVTPVVTPTPVQTNEEKDVPAIPVPTSTPVQEVKEEPKTEGVQPGINFDK